ncbi:MAG: hypothetical protein AAF489_03550 [Bacteroidota bacterium]
MKEVITRKNVIIFVKQRYGITVDELMTHKESNPELFEFVVESAFEEFADTVMSEKGNDINTFNPHTQSLEQFGEVEIAKIESLDDLMKGLSETHQKRMNHLNQSFHQELRIEKKKEIQKRSREVGLISERKKNKRDLER